MKVKFLIATALFVIVAGGGLMYIFMQQQPDGELFAQADFDVQDKTMAVDRMDWSTGKPIYEYVALTDEQQQHLLQLFEEASYKQVEQFPENYDYSLTLVWNTRHRLFIDITEQTIVDPENTKVYKITSNGEAIAAAFEAL